jgi:hypothetical protein
MTIVSNKYVFRIYETIYDGECSRWYIDMTSRRSAIVTRRWKGAMANLLTAITTISDYTSRQGGESWKTK